MLMSLRGSACPWITEIFSFSRIDCSAYCTNCGMMFDSRSNVTLYEYFTLCVSFAGHSRLYFLLQTYTPECHPNAVRGTLYHSLSPLLCRHFHRSRPPLSFSWGTRITAAGTTRSFTGSSLTTDVSFTISFGNVATTTESS